MEGFAERFKEAQKSSRRCDFSSLNLPALPLLPVAPDLDRLSRQLNQRQPPQGPDLQRIDEIEGAHAWHDATLSRSVKDPCPRSSWFRRLRNPPEQPGRKRRGPSLATAGPILQAAFIVFLAALLIAGRREKCVHGSSWANYSAQVSDRCDNGQNKTHTFSCQWFFHFCRRSSSTIKVYAAAIAAFHAPIAG